MKAIKIIAFSLFAILLENSHAFTYASEINEKTEQEVNEQDERQNNALQYWTQSRVSKEGTRIEQELANVGIHLPPGGMITAVYNPSPYNLEGIWLILGAKYQYKGEGGYLTPAEAQAIDIALLHGDGNPRLGSVRVFDGLDVTPFDCITNTNDYNLKNKKPACIVFIKLPT